MEERRNSIPAYSMKSGGTYILHVQTFQRRYQFFNIGTADLLYCLLDKVDVAISEDHVTLYRDSLGIALLQPCHRIRGNRVILLIKRANCTQALASGQIPEIVGL